MEGYIVYDSYGSRQELHDRQPAGRPWRALVIVLTFFVLLTEIILAILGSFPNIDTELFNSAVEEVPSSDAIQPHPATFSIWFFIFLYQLIWMCYGLYLIGASGPGGYGNLYYSPPYIPTSLYVVFILQSVTIVGWLFAFDRRRPDIALALLMATSVLLYICIVISVRALWVHGLTLYQAGMGVHVSLVRGLIHNGLALYATWVTIATLLNLGTVLQQYADFEDDVTGTVILAILGTEALAWVILDWCILEPYLRYIFTPYFVLLTALIGIIANRFEPWTVNAILLVALLVFVGLATLIKLILSGSRIQTMTDPILARAPAPSQRDPKATVPRQPVMVAQAPAMTYMQPMPLSRLPEQPVKTSSPATGVVSAWSDPTNAVTRPQIAGPVGASHRVPGYDVMYQSSPMLAPHAYNDGNMHSSAPALIAYPVPYEAYMATY